MRKVQQHAEEGLSDAQRRLLEKLTQRRLVESTHAEITRLPPGVQVPLSSSQARIWFFGRMYPWSTEYNSFGTISFTAAPDNARLEAALRTLIERHDALRLRIVERDEEPLQEECAELQLSLAYHDLSDLTEAEAERRAEEIGGANAQTPFQLDRPPLFRLSLIRLPAGKALLVFVFHHIIADGWSVSIFCEELTALLAEKPLPPPPAVRFLDYVSWQREHVSAERLVEHVKYWERKLGGELPVLDLPKDRPRPNVSSRRGAVVPCSIPPALIEPLRQLAAAESTTLFVALLGAYKALLLRLTGQPDLIVGAPFAGRDQLATEGVIGCFLNPVVLRTHLGGNPSFREILRRVRTTTLEAHEHHAVPFERVVEALAIPRDSHYSPVYQTLFALENAPSGALNYPGVELKDVVLDSETAKFDLTLALRETARGVSGIMEYSSDLFNEETVARYVEMYLRLITAMVAEPDRPVKAHSLISPEERERILHGLNKYERPAHHYRTMAEPFEEQVERTPDAIALVSDEASMTYATLNERANRLAHFLRGAGVGRGSFVALRMERSFSLVVALYGIAKAGAAYVPLDPELPDARVGFMLEDTAPSLVLVDENSRAKIPPGPWRVVCVDAEQDSWASLPAVNLPCEGPTNRLAYLLYTSGSTGRPKAVAYPIDGAIAHILWLQKFYPFGPGDANIFKTSYGFDVSTWEIFWALYFGARLVVCRPGGHRDASYLAEVIDRHQVTTIFLIPSMLQVFLQQLPAGGCRSLRWVLCGGEPVSPGVRDACYERLDARLVNVCGPTEAGTVTDIIIPPEHGAPTVPLGRPAANFRFYVLDEDLEVVPIGVPGEAFIGGDVGLAHCYYARPGLTAERFLPDPFGPVGGRMYRTGDVCRYRADGVLEHLGRIGTQVKLRGMRIELAEIEAVLCEHETVQACVALAVNDEVGQRILAFVVPQPDRQVVPQELTEQAGRLLPRFMLPASISSVSSIPATVNGKVDREALLKQWHEVDPAVTRELVPPSNEREERLKRIYEQLLGREDISVTDSFFDLGGHSLLAFKLISACVKEFHYRPSVADIFSSPSVRALCAGMNSPERAPDTSLVPLTPQPGKPIIVFIHAASGSALPFGEVAKHLSPGFSTFGLQALDVEDEPQTFPTIKSMAASYVEAVDAIRGLSPLIIAGWSMGGSIGLEMARQWRQQGVEVAAVLLLDSCVAPEAHASAEVRAEAQRSTQALDFLWADGLTPAQLDQTSDTFARLERVLRANVRAFWHYQPDWFDGEIDLLRAVEPLPEMGGKFPDDYASADRGWGPHVRGVRMHNVAGNHFTLMAKENAATLADVICGIVAARLSFSEV